MGLKDYHQKRNFSQTAEPEGLQNFPHQGALEFVVQEHHASHLHYDFRLEVEGVLKSWAIPKGPSLDPSEKRLAIQVEDHPFEYRTFEGTIPEGNYGAGMVKIWDSGTYTAAKATSRQESEHLLLKGLKEGRLNFILHGQKLRGAYSLIRLRGNQGKQWLLIKKRDEYASSPSQQTKLPTTTKHQPVLTHLDKIYWPDEGYTKGDLIHYYQQVAPLILPYLKDRPETLRRYPNGITGTSFYQKKAEHVPDWVRTEKIQHKNRTVDYILIEDEQSLLYVANLGCIDLNPFNSRLQSLYYPDYLVIDLDPENVEFDQVIEVARVIHHLLDKWSLLHVCKTSGATGMHIYLPMGAQYTFEEVSQFAHLIVHFIHQQIPDLTSLERSPRKRQQKVYLDYLQNNFAQTVVAPYSVRPRPEAPVSTPLKWSEVKAGLKPTDFTIKTVLKRFKKVGDLFQPALGKGIDLRSLLNNLQKGLF